MSLEKNQQKVNKLWKIKQNQEIEDQKNDTYINIESVLSVSGDAYQLLKEIEKNTKWYNFRQDTLDYIFKVYPFLGIEDFKKFFLEGVYNKNILSNNPEIIDLLNLDEIEAWSDLIEIVIDKILLEKEDFENSIDWAFDKITVPNMIMMDTAQWYFKTKLETFLPWTEVIFWDMPEIRNNIWYNQFSTDSVWFIDLLWNWFLNSCLFKLFKTTPDNEKVETMNEIFSNLDKNVFLWWSTNFIPFKTPDDLCVVKMPKQPINDGEMYFWKDGILLNSMWYLNSAYYADKVRWSFVLGSHNIAEPLHAGKLTVINNELENRHNHNWIISYFWEKLWLLMYATSDDNNKKELQEFLSLSIDEIKEKNEEFEKIYNEKIIPLIYWIFYRYLSKNFPNKIKSI